MKNSNRTRELRACSVVPQRIAPGVPHSIKQKFENFYILTITIELLFFFQKPPIILLYRKLPFIQTDKGRSSVDISWHCLIRKQLFSELRKYSINSILLISVINQHDAQNVCFTISFFHVSTSTCFERMCSLSGGQNYITQPLISSHL